MWLHRLTKYLLTHRWQAFALTVVITSAYAVPGGSLISSLGMIFACLVVLVKGPVEGALFTLAATLPYVVVAVMQGGVANLLPTTIVGVFVLSNILSWTFAVMLYRKASWSQIVQIEALVGIFAVSVIHLVYPGIIEWWAKEILGSLQLFKQVVTQNGWSSYIKLPPDMSVLAAQSAQTATGFTVDFILVASILQLIIARWWQNRAFNQNSLEVLDPGLQAGYSLGGVQTPSKQSSSAGGNLIAQGNSGTELYYIRPGYLAALCFVASFVFLYYGNSVVLDIMPVLILLFAIAGLSLMHYCFSFMPRSPGKWFWLTLTYIVILYTLQVSVLLLSMFALLDSWLDFRKRFKKV